MALIQALQQVVIKAIDIVANLGSAGIEAIKSALS